MEKSINTEKKPFIEGLNITQEGLAKLSSYLKNDIIKSLKRSVIKDGTVRVPKNIGAIFSLGIFIVAMVSLLIAVNSYSSFSTNKRLENLEKGQAHFETELKDIKLKLDQLLSRKS